MDNNFISSLFNNWIKMTIIIICFNISLFSFYFHWTKFPFRPWTLYKSATLTHWLIRVSRISANNQPLQHSYETVLIFLINLYEKSATQLTGMVFQIAQIIPTRPIYIFWIYLNLIRGLYFPLVQGAFYC